MENNAWRSSKPWSKKFRGVILLIILGLIVITILLFGGFFVYYTWQMKYGDSNQLDKQFTNDKSTWDSELADSVNKAKVIEADWKKYIRSANPVWGEPGAPVAILAFIDFACPYSQEAYAGFKLIEEKYEPVIRVVFKFMPLQSLHPQTMLAANAAKCAQEQGKFWSYHNLLFDKQILDNDSLLSYADELNLLLTSFSTCLAEYKYQADIDQDLSDAIELGVRGTPTYFVNGLKVEGAISLADWDKIILELLKQ